MTTITPTTPKANKAAAPQPETEEEIAAAAAKLREDVALGYATARVRDLGDGKIERTTFVNGERIVQIEENGKEKWNFA